ncbi:hypothetical protein K8O96_12010 [Clostridium sporogenes]|uniref:Uncharacterized protein n=1 Tax=Clostridium botulinum TaxID=1491 RepID=A0A6M0SY33_CLOBO|nr:hypothetical protein [Clostridium sporogenes]NFA59482.1 hypothetical protein [Clostridium botulinum]NFI74666.1 hypothetical protein [Clostridium sporogenes]NFL71199.1 hypothetical protein [Clostridium sporogenes]NFM26122.1 hypothetical protein [Clostridium sporogenes]NFP62472.1 hypothetical protein [Clostridium sporogenes]
MYNNRFCYRISKEAEIGWDENSKDYCEAYIETTIETKKEIPEDLKKTMIPNIRLGLASQLEVKPEYLEYIESDEYDQYVED